MAGLGLEELEVPVGIDAEQELGGSARGEPKAPTKDVVYFFATGDCVFLVENVLFKIHKERLTREPDPDCCFRGLFSSARDQGMSTMGEIDSVYEDDGGGRFEIIPIDDKLVDFRALCWVLYALPGDIQQQNESGADISRLVSVANMAHKYMMPSYEAWALYMIHIHGQAPHNYFDTCSQEMLYRVFEAGLDGGRDDICVLVEARWIPRLRKDELRLRDALDFGEKHGRRGFLGEAYYQQALRMPSFVPMIGKAQWLDFTQSDLTERQLGTLLRGFCSLSLLWQNLGHAQSHVSGCGYSSRNPLSDALALPRPGADSNNPLLFPDMRQALGNAIEACKREYCHCRRDYLTAVQDEFCLEHFFLGV
ncbi:BTB domain-containing protein [Mycena indigotica]|uniref:BTB domain-containing protein n=1 Tax=Mycena indigotica TaxID=2126181 RepID=A0A8H6SH10_9AGAR|nr:BTB domain-containing protein [Mycena indigotica]KAF7298650.1 BTB domain-containing protein [Mycena indigotica]